MPVDGATVTVVGLKETRRKIRAMPEDARTELKKRTQKVAGVVGDDARRRYTALGHQGPLIAGTLRVNKTTSPSISVGGTKKVGSRRSPAFGLLFGTEFGSNKYKQFHAAHTGQVGRAIYPSVRAKGPFMAAQWLAAVDEVAAEFGRGGNGEEEKLA